MTDYQAQTTTECLDTWCRGTAGHDGPHFPPREVVEAAARAMFAEEQCDRRQKLDLEANWTGRLDDRDRNEYRRLARAALEAAAPHAAAQALSEAADELAKLPYVRPDHPGRAEYERLLAIRRGNTDRWLRDRADSIRNVCGG